MLFKFCLTSRFLQLTSLVVWPLMGGGVNYPTTYDKILRLFEQDLVCNL